MRDKLTPGLGFNAARLMVLVAVFAEFSKIDATGCPEVKNKEDNLFIINSMCYHFIATPDVQVTFDSAQPDCVSRGGHLVTIKDNETQAELTSVLQQKAESHTILIGLRRQGELWKWVTGEPLAYNNWKDASTCRSCDCAKLKLRETGVWEGFSCQATDWFTAYVCEYEPTSSSAKRPFLSVLSTITAVMIVMLCHRL
ncbi:collectin-12-like isoform X2 [Mercenaria mercenaria]|uniref:collectin-12-like isoform X2 n=1 Tax=Mercenaria mercenaria TaxID=6596 RepID=UPI00234F7DED|nr:collectin-12-like isoform X2 [Mercenaria mercenaria]